MKAKKSAKKKQAIRSIGVLCSGGDAPGMNAAIRAVVRAGISRGLEVHGIFRGYSGLLEGDMEPMNLRSVANIIQRGGTVLKTTRCPAFLQKKSRLEAANLLRRKGIDALVVIGGDGSYAGAHLLEKETGFPVMGLPGTIDNDIVGSEYTIGFDTAVNTAVEAIDKIRDTASSHDRVFLVEVMGRTSTEIATWVAVSGGAEMVYVPGDNTQLDELIKTLQASKERGKLSSIVIVCEGDEPGHSEDLRRELKKRAGLDSRAAILGHIQRGGSPSAMDRYMASLMGAAAVDSLLLGRSNVSIGIVKGKVATIPLTASVSRHKKPDTKILQLVQRLAN